MYQSVQPFRTILREQAQQILRLLQFSAFLQGILPTSPPPAFDHHSQVCVEQPADQQATDGERGVGKYCTKLCNMDCLTALNDGEKWLRCLFKDCPGTMREEYSSLGNDSIIVAVGGVSVPLEQDFSAPSRSSAKSKSVAPKQRNIETSANSSFLANIKELMGRIRSRLPFQTLRTRVAVVQKFGGHLCRRHIRAKVTFTIQSSKGTRSITTTANKVQSLAIDVPMEEGMLVFQTKVEGLPPLEADQCITPVWVEPRIVPRVRQTEADPTPAMSCKSYCTEELFKSGRAPLTCFVNACNGSRVRIDSSTSQHQPYVIFPCHNRPMTLGVDRAVGRRIKNISFFHDYTLSEYTPGLGMKGNSEITFDLAMIRHNLSNIATRVIFDILSSRVGLVPISKDGCDWTEDGTLRLKSNHSSIMSFSVSAKFSVFADGNFAGATSVKGLLTKDIVVNLKPSSKLLTLRVSYNDSLSRRCTRPAWSEVELQQTRPLHFLPCQKSCWEATWDGVFPLSCFTGMCSGNVARQSFRPYFWIEEAMSGVGVDKTVGSSTTFHLGAERTELKNGLGAEPTSKLIFDLNAFRRSNVTFNTFSSFIGIDVSSICGLVLGRADFRVYLDNTLVLGRQHLHPQNTGEEFFIPVDGARWLKLVTSHSFRKMDPMGLCAHAVWGNAKLWTLRAR